MLLQFLKKSLLFICGGIVLVFTSCNEDPSASDSVYDASKNSPEINVTESDDTDTTETRTIKVENDALQDSPTKESNTAVRLNPAHGEPGHSCEIPVGQPLPSSSPASNNTGNAPTKNNNTAKLNPPHGEPGHSCEIPVGQPLN